MKQPKFLKHKKSKYVSEVGQIFNNYHITLKFSDSGFIDPKILSMWEQLQVNTTL